MSPTPSPRAGLAAPELEQLKEMLRGLHASLSIGLEDRIAELEKRLVDGGSPALKEIAQTLGRLERQLAELPGRLVAELDSSEWAVAAPTVARSRRR